MVSVGGFIKFVKFIKFIKFIKFVKFVSFPFSIFNFPFVSFPFSVFNFQFSVCIAVTVFPFRRMEDTHPAEEPRQIIGLQCIMKI